MLLIMDQLFVILINRFYFIYMDPLFIKDPSFNQLTNEKNNN